MADRVRGLRLPLAASRAPVAVLAGVASGVAGIILQGHTAVGGSVLDASSPSVIQGVLETHFGLVWGVRVLVWLAYGGLLMVAYSRGGLPAMRPVTLSADGLALPGGVRDRQAPRRPARPARVPGPLAGPRRTCDAQDPTAVLLPSTLPT